MLSKWVGVAVSSNWPRVLTDLQVLDSTRNVTAYVEFLASLTMTHSALALVLPETIKAELMILRNIPSISHGQTFEILASVERVKPLTLRTLNIYASY